MLSFLAWILCGGMGGPVPRCQCPIAAPPIPFEARRDSSVAVFVARFVSYDYVRAPGVGGRLYDEVRTRWATEARWKGALPDTVVVLGRGECDPFGVSGAARVPGTRFIFFADTFSRAIVERDQRPDQATLTHYYTVAGCSQRLERYGALSDVVAALGPPSQR